MNVIKYLFKALLVYILLSKLIVCVSIMNKSEDTSTYSNYNQIRQSHMTLNLVIDFSKKLIFGIVTIRFNVIEDNTDKIILDVNNLIINSVHIGNTGPILQFTYDNTYNPDLGSGLVISLDRMYMSNESLSLIISYSTTDKGEAIQFMDPEITSDPSRGNPFMFTQSEMIAGRSMIPCQDTPLIKVKVDAYITAPSNLEVMFGGRKIKKTNNENGTSTHYFIQDIPIPSYLISIACGEIVGKEILYEFDSNITIKIWAEPVNIQCAYETFKTDLPLYLKAAIEYMFSYEWKSYDILILPKSFPYGGMENPNMTFATPSILNCKLNDKGEYIVDKSQVFIAAHELAHSWTGNLVTNANWDNFWLNEGFAVFFERKIIEKVYGIDMRLLESELNYPNLIDDVNVFIKKGWKDLTKLKIILKKRCPDGSYGRIPYEKGFGLLNYLERVVLNDESAFQRILQGYIYNNRYKTVVYTDFTEHFYREIDIIYKDDQKRLSQIKENINFEDWISEEGEPRIITNDYSNKLSVDYKAEYEYYLKEGQFEPEFKTKFLNWNSLQKEGFLLLIKDSNDKKTSSYDLITYLRNELDLKNDSLYNLQIRFRWLQIELKNKMNKEIKKYLSSFLSSTGKQFYVRNLYDSWMTIDKNEAYEDFVINRSNYHPMVVTSIQKDFDLIKNE